MITFCYIMKGNGFCQQIRNENKHSYLFIWTPVEAQTIWNTLISSKPCLQALAHNVLERFNLDEGIGSSRSGLKSLCSKRWVLFSLRKALLHPHLNFQVQTLNKYSLPPPPPQKKKKEKKKSLSFHDQSETYIGFKRPFRVGQTLVDLCSRKPSSCAIAEKHLF